MQLSMPPGTLKVSHESHIVHTLIPLVVKHAYTWAHEPTVAEVVR